MREVIHVPLMLAGGLLAILVSTGSALEAVNVSQHRNHGTRDGLDIDSAFTPALAAGLKRDLNFDGRVTGNVYAQPLYIEGGPGGKAMVIVVTESNYVFALAALSGVALWRTNVGPPVASMSPVTTRFMPSSCQASQLLRSA